MALIKCPVCNSHISELETNCPNCDFHLSEDVIYQIKMDQEREKESKPNFKRKYSGSSSWMAYR